MAKETYTVRFLDESTQDITLSFALLNLLAGFVGELTNVVFVTTDPALRADMIRQLLAERDERGKIVKEYSEFAKPMSIEEGTNLLLWVQENLYDFFTKTLTKNQGYLAKAREQVEATQD